MPHLNACGSKKDFPIIIAMTINVWSNHIQVTQMQPALTFIIPVRHQENCKDWPTLKTRLTDTIRSICAQDNPNWNAVIIANHGADLPDMPPGFQVIRVAYPPNPLHEQGQSDKETFYESFRLDKGRRILAGMLATGTMRYAMVVDDDDFVSRRLTSFVAEHPTANGWYVHNGYVWGDQGTLLYRYNGFSSLCGTSHIIRADLYDLPPTIEVATDTYIKKMLGSHVQIEGYLANRGTPLAPLPFVGAVYRIGHSGAHSKSADLISHFFFHRWLLKKPTELVRRLSRLRWLTESVRREFFGTQAGHSRR